MAVYFIKTRHSSRQLRLKFEFWDADKALVKGKYNLLDGQEIRLTALVEEGWSGAARILQVNAPVVVVECTAYVPPGTAIRVDAGDALLLGECRRCEPDCGWFKAEVKLEQVIPSVSDLAKLMSAIGVASKGVPAQYAASQGHTRRVNTIA
jgi:hypothetical protein